MVLSVDACCVRPSYGARPALSIGMSQQFSVFLSLVTLTFDIDVRTWARFLYNVPNRQYDTIRYDGVY